MADWVGSLQNVFSDQSTGGNRCTVGNLSANVTAVKELPPQVFTGVVAPTTPGFGGSFESTGEGLIEQRAVVIRAGALFWGPSENWFEMVHVAPQYFELGNLVTTILRDIEIYNAYRSAARTLTTATNNAGEGVSFKDLPGLPWYIEPQSGLIFQVQVLTDGPPNIDGTLDFVLDTVSLSLPITGTRVVMFAFEPETPIIETLEFLTDVIQAIDGSEQRFSLRSYPRQILEMALKLDEDSRREFQTLMFGFQSGTFGLPIWYEARELTANVSAGALTVQADTRWADFRVGGLAIVWTDEDTFDALEVESKTDSSVTFTSALLSNHLAGVALVMPLRLAVTEDQIAVKRYPVNLDEVPIRFNITNNEVSLADVSAFSTHSGKVMLDDPNFIAGGTLDDNLFRKLVRLDNGTAPMRQSSDWVGSHYRTSKGFVCNTAQAIWEARQLAHALRGSQVSFYLPTFYADLVITGNLASGSTLVDIRAMGYTGLIANNEPNASIWIELLNGTILTREVTECLVLDSTTERLTVDSAWASTITPAEIRRVSFLRLCRIADDTVVFTHTGSGEARVNLAVVAGQT